MRRLLTETKVEAIAAAAQASLSRHGVAPTPENYAIWFEYHSGDSPALCRMVDILLSNGRVFDEQVMEDLHQKFFTSTAEQAALQETSQRIRGTLSQVSELVRDAGADAFRFGATVRGSSGEFVNGQASLGVLIERLMQEAQEVAERSAKVGEQLRSSADVIHKLARNLDDARKEAVTDGLTGLANRRAFDQMLREMAGAAMNSGEGLSLLIMDIDHFKVVNDTWGHPVGDQVLRLVASVLTGRLREGDRAARYGGEEFAVILPGARAEGARVVAEAIREAFVGRQIVMRETGQTIPGVTLSVGVGEFIPGERLSSWVARTDAALYSAKHGGRNRVAVAAAPAQERVAAA